MGSGCHASSSRLHGGSWGPPPVEADRTESQLDESHTPTCTCTKIHYNSLTCMYMYMYTCTCICTVWGGVAIGIPKGNELDCTRTCDITYMYMCTHIRLYNTWQYMHCKLHWNPLSGHTSTTDTCDTMDNSECPDRISMEFNTFKPPQQRTPRYSV